MFKIPQKLFGELSLKAATQYFCSNASIFPSNFMPL